MDPNALDNLDAQCDGGVCGGRVIIGCHDNRNDPVRRTSHPLRHSVMCAIDMLCRVIEGSSHAAAGQIQAPSVDPGISVDLGVSLDFGVSLDPGISLDTCN